MQLHVYFNGRSFLRKETMMGATKSNQSSQASNPEPETYDPLSPSSGSSSDVQQGDSPLENEQTAPAQEKKQLKRIFGSN